MASINKSLFFLGTIVFLSVGIFAHEGHSHDDYDEESDDVSFVTCGSTIKLRHEQTNFRLHSHNVNYGSGSGQQSVTGYPNVDDPNSLWVVKGILGKHCSRGTPIKNGEQIRLEHLNTKKFLHSHLHQSPLSKQQEVSAYSDNGGDTGDHWKIIISDTYWKRGSTVRFQHVDTNRYLSSNNKKFSNPIPGQQEICAVDKMGEDTRWAAEEGFYFPPNQEV